MFLQLYTKWAFKARFFLIFSPSFSFSLFFPSGIPFSTKDKPGLWAWSVVYFFYSLPVFSAGGVAFLYNCEVIHAKKRYSNSFSDFIRFRG